MITNNMLKSRLHIFLLEDTQIFKKIIFILEIHINFQKHEFAKILKEDTFCDS